MMNRLENWGSTQIDHIGCRLMDATILLTDAKICFALCSLTCVTKYANRLLPHNFSINNFRMGSVYIMN